MATLTGNSVQSTYDSLIKIGDNTSGFASLKQLSDGLGNLMPIKFSSAVVDFQTATDVNFTGVNVIGISSTDTTYDLTSAQSTNDVNVNLVPSLGATDTIKFVAGTNVTLTDNGSNQITIDAAGGGGGGVTSLEGLTGVLDLVGTQNLTVTDNGSNTITLTGYDDTPVTTNAANIATNTTDIATNAADISNNTNDITQNETDIATNAGNISTNSTNIGTNTANIATNTADIVTNTGNIASNLTLIGANLASINTNASDITANSGNILTNAANIQSANANIVNNTNNIATNTADIATLNAAGYVDTSGSPLAGNIAYFSDADTITGEAGFTYNAANDRLDAVNIQASDLLIAGEGFKYTFPGVNQWSGELADFGAFPSAPTIGRIYYFGSNGFWLAYNNSALATTQGILGVALSSTEVLLRGMVRTALTLTRGVELWGANNSSFTATQPSGGDYARLMGHAIDTDKIYFNPSQEYIETT